MGLDTVELVMAVEDEFRVAIPNDLAPKLVQLSDLHAFMVRALGERGDPSEPAAVWERLKRVVLEQCAVRDEQVVPESHIVYDLGLD